MKKYFNKINTFMFMFLGTLTVIASVSGDTAGASATGCTFYGSGIKGGILNGQFCAGIKGTGQKIDLVTGNFGTTITGIDSVCNPSIKIDAYDSRGNWYGWTQGKQKTGCSWGTWNSVNSIVLNKCAKVGFVRVTLQSYGQSVATVQFSIKAGGCSGGGGW